MSGTAHEMAVELTVRERGADVRGGIVDGVTRAFNGEQNDAPAVDKGQLAVSRRQLMRRAEAYLARHVTLVLHFRIASSMMFNRTSGGCAPESPCEPLRTKCGTPSITQYGGEWWPTASFEFSPSVSTPHADRNVFEHARVADVFAIDEKCGEKSVDQHRSLRRIAPLDRLSDGAQSRSCVGQHGDPIERERNAHCISRVLDLCAPCSDRCRTAEPGEIEGVERHTFRGCGRQELMPAPSHVRPDARVQFFKLAQGGTQGTRTL